MNSLRKFYPLKRTSNVMRLMNSKIGEETHIYNLMKKGVVEHHRWFLANQACFIAGMEYMKSIVEDPVSNDVFFVPEDHISKTFKNTKKTQYKLEGVDNSFDDR